MNSPTKIQTFSRVTVSERIADDVVHLLLEAPDVAREARAGQFVNVRVGQTEAPLLRRPFSIGGSDGQREISLVFRVVGVGTRLLADRKPGESVDIIGPLGHPFDIDPERPAILVAGGMGIPPIAFLARALKARDIPARLYYGVRTKAELPALCDAEEQVDRLYTSTDDGSAGHHGLISELVERDIADDCHVYACGPHPLLEALIRIVRERGIPAQLSFEQQMACGSGACMGCSIDTVQGYQRVCTEGPVFPAEAFFT